MKTLLLMTLVLGISGLSQSVFASERSVEACKEALALKAAQTAQSIYGDDSSDSDIECLARYNTIISISDNRYSINVDCGDLDTKTFDVTVEPKTDSLCLTSNAVEEDSAE